MKSSIDYYKKIALTSHFVIFKTNSREGGGQFGKLYENYFSFADTKVLGGKSLEANFPGEFIKIGGKVKPVLPNQEFWYAEDDDDFRRGDIVMLSNQFPPLTELENVKMYVLWNYSMIMNQAVDKWIKKEYSSTDEKYLVQSTNRVLGNEYLIIAATLPGLNRLFTAAKETNWFFPWENDTDPYNEAVVDIKRNWANKWFVKLNSQ